MKLKNLLMKALFVAFGLCVGQSVWADKTIGATSKGWDNDDCCTTAYTLQSGKTLTFEFTVGQSRKGYVADGWVTILCSTSARNDGAHHYVFMRDDCYGVNAWDWTNKTTAQTGWFLTNENNYAWTADWNDFQNNIIEGASVVQTICRNGTEAYIISDVTTSVTNGSKKFRHFFAMDLGTTADIYVFLGSDFAQLNITSDAISNSEQPSLTGTLVGKLNKTGRLADHGNIENFTVKPEGSLTLNFVLHSSKLFDWGQWLYEIADASDMYTLSVGNSNSWNNLKVGEVINKTNWPATNEELFEKMDGATIKMTVTRSGASVTMEAIHTPLVGDDFTITATVTPTKEGFATSDITVRPLVELGYLDLLPVTKAVTAAGWATYCSPYALDLEHATGLTDAYIVTGGENGVLTKTSVKGGTVPANTGLLLKADEGTVTMPIVGASTTDVSANKLIGKTETFNLPANEGYVLMATGINGLGFYQNAKAFTVGANTAYLPANFAGGGTGAREFFSLDDDATAISEAKSQQPIANGLFFDLQGRKVAQPQKGLYIVNGKKVVMK